MIVNATKDELYNLLNDKIFIMENNQGTNKIYLDNKDIDDIIYDTLNVGGIQISKDDVTKKIKIKYKFANCELNEIDVTEIERCFLEIETILERFKYKLRLEKKNFDIDNNKLIFELYIVGYGDVFISHRLEKFYFVINEEQTIFDTYEELKNFLLNFLNKKI